MNRICHALRVVMVGFVLGFGGTAFAAPFQNGSFEVGGVANCNFQLLAGDMSITGWEVSVGNIELLDSSCWPATRGTRSLDLIGLATSSGGVKQTFDTVSGQTYLVSFDLAGNPSLAYPPAVKNLTVTVSSDGVPRPFTFDTTGHIADTFPNHMGWTTKFFTFVANSTSTTIDFVSDMLGATAAGAALDNVRIEPLAGPNDAWVARPDLSPGLVYGGRKTAAAPPVDCTNPASWTPSGLGPFGPFGPYPLAVTSNGVNGPVVVSYDVPQGNTASGICGSWTTTATAGASGDVTVQWDYRGDHASFEVTAALRAFVLRDGPDAGTDPDVVVQEDYVLVNAAAGGSFLYSGQYTFHVQAGDVYGFTMTGSNFDSTDAMFGTLFLTHTFTPAGALAAPRLVRSVALTNPSVAAYVIGRADVTGITPITVNASVGSSCTGGSLGGASSLGSFSTTTDASGYFAVTLPNVVSGKFVAVQQTAPSATATSACIANSGDNDYWPKALSVDPLPSQIASDWIDAPGKARWYKFSVTPGQKITVTLSGLPADYDIVVFKDIYQAFVKQLAPTDTTALTKLNSEFAPSTFSPSTFSPSTFSPSTFSPDAYAPLALAPSTFSPSTFSPSTFSPSTFSPSTFSPSTFSPSTFSPSTFSPSTFSPTFSPSTFSPSTVFYPTSCAVNNVPGCLTAAQIEDLVKQAFSSAQTRSIMGVSATPGTAQETVVINSWNETGNFYVRVAGRGDAFSTSGQFNLSVAKTGSFCSSVAPLEVFPTPPYLRSPALGPNVKTVILLDSTQVALGTQVGGGTLLNKLQAFAARTEIGGVIVDVSTDSRVNALKTQAAAHKDCPYATNLVAEEIKSIVDSYRPNNSGLRYVVIVGNDGAIPFFRYPDETLIGQESGYDPPVNGGTISDASLSQDYVLSQDAYGAKTRIAMRTIQFPVPGLAVGRLVETPAEIAGLIDAYTAANGVVVPSSSLVTGYDFLADAANAVRDELQAGINVAPQELIAANGVSPGASWTATQLGTALLGSRHDVIFLAGHFSANSALAADFSTSIVTTDLAASATNFTNSIIFSAGCHAGYNIVDADAIPGVTVKLDWVQAFAQKKATLVAGTGYQYGDTDFVEYSERLYKNFAKQLRAGTGAISVGEALVRAKTDYLAVTPDVRGIHLKAVLEATVFGLPQLSVNMPAGRGSPLPDQGVINTTAASGNAGTLGLQVATIQPFSVAAAPTRAAICLKNPPFDDGAPGAPVLAFPFTAPCLPIVTTSGTTTYTKAEWLNGPDGVVSNPAEPVLPLQAINVTPSNSSLVLRGVGFDSGTYMDTSLVPLTGAPTTELRGVHTSFSSPLFFPMRLSTTNYFGALSGTGGTKLLVTPAQHRADSLALGTSIQRKYTDLKLRLYYSSNLTATALSAPPTIVSVNAVTTGNDVTFTARVVGDPAAAIHGVWVTYTDGAGTWESRDLIQCGPSVPVCGTTTDTQHWMYTLVSAPANIKYIVQAVNGVGLVAADDNLGAYYPAYAGTPPQAAAATTLTLTPPASPIVYGDTPQVTATLTSAVPIVDAQPLSFSVGGTASTKNTTPPSGEAQTNLAKVAPGTYQIVASYAGNTSYLPSSASTPITVSPAPSIFRDDPLTIAPAAFLVRQVGGLPVLEQPLTQELVTLAVSQNGTTLKYFTVRTDFEGRAALPATGLPIGTYNVSASFAGSELYLGTSASLATNLQVTTPCPLGEKTKVRWHYSVNGAGGNWSSDKQISCADGSVAYATQALDSAQTVAPLSTVNIGYALQLPGNKTHFNAIVNNAKAIFQLSCVSGTASPSSLTITIPNQILLLDNNNWNPSSNKNDPLTFQGTGTVPNACSGGQVRLNQGGSFSAFISLN